MLGYIRANGHDLAPETLVFVIRDQRGRGHNGVVEMAAQCLLGRRLGDGSFTGGHCEHIIQKQARTFGVKGDALNDFRARCWQEIWKGILHTTGSGRFWEERFYMAVKMRAIDVGRVMRREEDRFVAGNESTEYEQPRGSLEDEFIAQMSAESLMQALGELPKGQRRAGWLRWIEGYPIESGDVEHDTISAMMGISSRMVRRHLEQARAVLEKVPVALEARAKRAEP